MAPGPLGMGRPPRRTCSHLLCHAPTGGLQGGSGGGSHLRLSCVYFKPVAGPLVPAGGASAEERWLQPAPAGRDNSGKPGLRQAAAMAIVQPGTSTAPRNTCAGATFLPAGVMALQAACLPLVSILGGRLLAQPRARTGRIPAGETQPQVLAPSSSSSPGAVRSGCWVLESYE